MDCKCKVIVYKHDEPDDDESFIDYCSLHLKAPEMYQALIKANGIALANIGGIGAIDEEGLLKEMQRIVDAIMPLISQIEGTK